MSAAESYAARVDAVNAQRARLRGTDGSSGRWSEALARRFRVDPHREVDPHLAAIASYVEPDDVVVDVGGGAGRIGLPLALRCREVVNVDPSPAMGAEFAACAAEAGIANARFVAEAWLDAAGVEGDVVLVANVTYFVRDIVPFLDKLDAAARRRVLISVWTVPPPEQDRDLFRLVYGEPQAPVPGYRELLPVLWEMGILPEVRVLPNPMREGGPAPQTREQAVRWALLRLREEENTAAQATVERHFDDLFAPSPDGFVARWRPAARELLLTWEQDRE